MVNLTQRPESSDSQFSAQSAKDSNASCHMGPCPTSSLCCSMAWPFQATHMMLLTFSLRYSSGTLYSWHNSGRHGLAEQLRMMLFTLSLRYSSGTLYDWHDSGWHGHTGRLYMMLITMTLRYSAGSVHACHSCYFATC